MAKIRYRGSRCAKTDIGRVRIENEDQALALVNSDGDILLAIADGMGGQNKGDYASKVAIDTMVDCFKKLNFKGPFFFKRNWLVKAIRLANGFIYKEAQNGPLYKDMGTTIVSVYISGANMMVANIGDSRAYMLTQDKELVRLTQDQTYVDYLYRTGKIDEQQLKSHPDRHVLMNALGIFPSISVDMKSIPYHGESILLCSDGLYNNVPESVIRTILLTDDRADQKVAALIAAANANGGSDNIGISYWESIDHD